jgi:limonene-1,2-epoxide hydrolase
MSWHSTTPVGACQGGTVTEEEAVVSELLAYQLAAQQDVDAMAELLAEDIVRTVPSLDPLIGRDACRAEQARENEFMRFGLPGSEVRNIASRDGVVFAEWIDVFELAGRPVTLPVVGVFEVKNGKVALWREYFDTGEISKQLSVDPTAYSA